MEDFKKAIEEVTKSIQKMIEDVREKKTTKLLKRGKR